MREMRVRERTNVDAGEQAQMRIPPKKRQICSTLHVYGVVHVVCSTVRANARKVGEREEKVLFAPA